MYRIYNEIIVRASLENCFDLSRSIDFYVEAMGDTNERPVNGKTRGLIELGDLVEWEGKRMFVKRRVSSKITYMKRPHFFVDEMVNGGLKSFSHKHKFVRHKSSEVLMIDEFRYEVPLGVLGRIVNYLFFERYMRELLVKRSRKIKGALESDQWRRFL